MKINLFPALPFLLLLLLNREIYGETEKITPSNVQNSNSNNRELMDANPKQKKETHQVSREEETTKNTNEKHYESQQKLSESLPRKHKQRMKYGKLPKVSVLMSSHCNDDIMRFCPKQITHSDMGILDCLQTDDEIIKQLSKKCHHTLWQFKKNLTMSNYFNKITGGICQEEFDRFPECVKADEKFKVSCLLDNKENIQTKQCLTFLNRVASIIFSDYRLVYKFVEKCESDIERHNCGRVQIYGKKQSDKEDSDKSKEDADDDDEEDEMDSTSQGSTIECLMKKVSNLNKQCAKEVLRVAELQSDDFHLDRQLYFACREDRELLCSDVAAGEGRVYKCLMRNMFNPKMSDGCKSNLRTRENVIQQDSKADYVFFEHCKDSIEKYKCRVAGNDDQSPVNHASTMLCLEAQEKLHADSLTAECKSQLLEWRQLLLSDYKITPEIVHHCQATIPRCSKYAGEPGGVIHCLLDEAKKNPGSDENGKDGLTSECLRALESLIKVADPGSDIKVDPVIQSVCHDDITNLCSNSRRGHGDVYECLLRHFADDDNIGSPQCREKVMELAYIVSRDYKFNEKLFTVCHDSAVQFCGADKEWYNKEISVSKDHVVFNCLHSKLREVPSPLNKKCAAEIRNILYYSRGRIELEPWLYEPCFTDLVKKCPNKDSPGDKHKCLQDNLDTLKEECRKAVDQFTADAQLDLQLDAIAYRTCKKVAVQLCHEEMLADKENDGGRLLHCMAEHKYSPKMTEECRAVVDHYQILSLKDISGSPRLRRACRKDYETHCKGTTKTGNDVIHCLSEVKLRNAILPIKKAENSDDDYSDQVSDVRLQPECEAEINFELLQRSTNYQLDPELASHCDADVKAFCSDVKPGRRRVTNCLEDNRKNLSDSCHDFIFKRERQLAQNQRMDKILMDACADMINKYCSQIEHPRRGLIRCLARHLRSEATFDSQCKKVLVKRMKVRNLDIRLHPLLKKACSKDIKERCEHVTPGQNNDSPKEFNGRVINCLKMEYIKSEKSGKALESACEDHIRDVIINSNLMYHLDPVLVGACGKEIKDKCTNEALNSDSELVDGEVTRCLKKAFVKNNIQDKECQKEVLRLMGEAQADVHVDPVLYRSCSLELRTVCGSVLPGAGRQMSCLLWAREDKEASKQISRNCEKELRDRVDMWVRAAKLAPPESMSELFGQVASSGARNYLLAVISIIILGIFIFGLCFGRVTKRVLVQEKNK